MPKQVIEYLRLKSGSPRPFGAEWQEGIKTRKSDMYFRMVSAVNMNANVAMNAVNVGPTVSPIPDKTLDELVGMMGDMVLGWGAAPAVNPDHQATALQQGVIAEEDALAKLMSGLKVGGKKTRKSKRSKKLKKSRKH